MSTMNEDLGSATVNQSRQVYRYSLGDQIIFGNPKEGDTGWLADDRGIRKLCRFDGSFWIQDPELTRIAL